MKYTNAAAERIPPKMDAMRVKDHGRRKNDSGNFRDYFLPITSITHKQASPYTRDEDNARHVLVAISPVIVCFSPL
ncbi:MAG: hypothetical protein WBB65_04120 [Anaerolineales bacterium]